LNFEIGRNLLVIIPFLVAGIYTGEILHNKIKDVLFKKIVFAFLLLIGFILII